MTAVILAVLTWVSLRVTAMPDAVPASAPLDQFSSARAFEHLKAMPLTPGPTGSVENAIVRDYIISQIEAFGLTPEIQSAVAVHPDLGTAFQVENILVRLPGTDSTRAVLFVGHYDGVGSGPGIGDNRLSVASMLEAMRTLQVHEPLRNDVIFLFPDAEEYGLVGANVFVEEHPWARDVGVVFNYDASDGRGPLVLMHTAEEDGWLVRNLVAADSGAFLKSQQNSERDAERWGQDFDVFEAAGYTGANMNNWTNQAYYHSRLDNVDHVDERKLQAYGFSMVQLAEHFGRIDLSETRAGDRVFTSVFDTNLVLHYSNTWTWPLTLLAMVGVVGVLAFGLKRQRLNPLALAKSVAALVGLLLVGTLLVTVAWSVIEGMHPEAVWQQEVDIYQGSLLLDGLIAFVVAGFIALLGWGSRRLGVDNLQAAGLILVLLLAVFAASTDPLFSYVALWPLLAFTIAAGLSFLLPLDQAPWHRWLRAALYWLAAIPAFGLFVPLLEQVLWRSTESGVVAPALLTIVFLALIVSLIDLVLPAVRFWAVGVAVATGIVLLIVGMARSGFNAEQPRPHTLFYVLNADTGAAQWVTLDEDQDAWIAQFVPPATAQSTTSGAVLGLPEGFELENDWLIPVANAWTGDAPVLDAPPPQLDVVADRREGDMRTLSLRVTSPRHGRVVYLAPDQEVVSASVEGKPIRVFPGWRFVFVGLPPEGVELELVVRGSDPTRLIVFDQTDGIPVALAAEYSPEPEDMMTANMPRWARGYPAFVSKTYVFD
ncbi:M28 family peptidase [Aggregatilinea lenta]|uniref:M28 family peptidase n=1 Tax=Aggregatilinea lenta TaxID=913108 RepID=UPI0013C2F72A|nr:M28 family peptidase [Aggregatilinea lenta]